MKRRTGLVSNSSSSSFAFVIEDERKLKIFAMMEAFKTEKHHEMDRVLGCYYSYQTVEYARTLLNKQKEEYFEAIAIMEKKLTYLESLTHNPVAMQAVGSWIYLSEEMQSELNMDHLDPIDPEEVAVINYDSKIEKLKRDIKKRTTNLGRVQHILDKLEGKDENLTFSLVRLDNWDAHKLEEVLELLDIEIIETFFIS